MSTPDPSTEPSTTADKDQRPPSKRHGDPHEEAAEDVASGEADQQA